MRKADFNYAQGVESIRNLAFPLLPVVAIQQRTWHAHAHFLLYLTDGWRMIIPPMSPITCLYYCSYITCIGLLNNRQTDRSEVILSSGRSLYAAHRLQQQVALSSWWWWRPPLFLSQPPKLSGCIGKNTTVCNCRRRELFQERRLEIKAPCFAFFQTKNYCFLLSTKESSARASILLLLDTNKALWLYSSHSCPLGGSNNIQPVTFGLNVEIGAHTCCWVS